MERVIDHKSAAEALVEFPNALEAFASFVADEDWDLALVEGLDFEITELEDVGLERGEAVSLLRRLEDYGVGKFITGRRGWTTRLEITTNENECKKIIHEAKQLKSGLSNSFSEAETHSLEVSYHLRPDFLLSMRVPSDFSNSDAERLKRWIDTLPFD